MEGRGLYRLAQVADQQMYVDQLSYDADRLLAGVERDPRCPHYCDDTFRRKLTKARQYEARLPQGFHARRPTYLIEAEGRELLILAGLTDAQMEAVCLRLDGCTMAEIGRKRGHSKQGAHNIFNQAAKKLRATRLLHPYLGLAEVYEDEVSRGIRNRGRRPIKRLRVDSRTFENIANVSQ